MKLNWGKCRIVVRKCSDLAVNPNPFIEFPTPVQSSTTLETTKGDKVEAKVEGGENEDVRYNRNTYALTTRIRTLKGRNKPLRDDDGIIDGEYEFYLQPEDPTAPGMFMARSTASEADQFNADDGGAWEYMFDALKNLNHNKGQIQWGVVTITGSGQSLNVTFVAVGTIGLTPEELTFTSAADSTGQVVTASESVTSDNVSIPAGDTWLTKTVSGTSITLKVAANTGAARSSIVTVTNGDLVGYIYVTQAASA